MAKDFSNLGNQRKRLQKKKQDKFSAAVESHLLDGGKDEVVQTTNLYPISSLVDNPLNARRFYRPDQIESLGESIKQEGQLVPLLITKDPEDSSRYLVIDGHYRLKALKHIGETHAKCDLVENVEGLMLYIKSRVANDKRNPQSVFDDALSFQGLLDKNLVSTAFEITEIIGKSEATVSKYLSLAEIPEKYMEALTLKETPIGLRAAYSLYQTFKVADTDSFDKLIQKVIDNDWSVTRIEAEHRIILRSLEKNNRKTTQAPTASTINISGKSGKKVGSIKIVGNKVSMNLTAPNDEVANELSKAIEQILHKNLGE